MGKFEAIAELGPLGWLLAIVVVVAPKLVTPFILIYLVRRFKFLQRLPFLQYFVKKKEKAKAGDAL